MNVNAAILPAMRVKEAAGLFCIVSYHHQIVVELGKYRFDTFTESLVCPCRRMPVFLIQPIWNFKSDICCLKEILLDLSTEIAFVSKHHAIMVFPAYVLEKMKVMNTCGSHVKGMDNTKYSADNMELIAIIVRSLARRSIPSRAQHRDCHAPWRSVSPVTFRQTFHRFGVNAEHIFGAINGNWPPPCGFPRQAAPSACVGR